MLLLLPLAHYPRNKHLLLLAVFLFLSMICWEKKKKKKTLVPLLRKGFFTGKTLMFSFFFKHGWKLFFIVFLGYPFSSFTSSLSSDLVLNLSSSHPPISHQKTARNSHALFFCLLYLPHEHNICS